MSFKQSIEIASNVPYLSKHHTLAATYVALARVLNKEKRLDDQLVELIKAQEIFSKPTRQASADTHTHTHTPADTSDTLADTSDPYHPHDAHPHDALSCVIGDDACYNFVSAQSDHADVEKELGNFFFDKGEEPTDDPHPQEHPQELEEASSRALQHYTRALSLYKQVFGDGHPKTARALWGLGIVQKQVTYADVC